MRRCTGVTIAVGGGGYVFIEVGGVVEEVGNVEQIHIHDEGVALVGEKRWALVPWHRVWSAEGDGQGGWK